MSYLSCKVEAKSGKKLRILLKLATLWQPRAKEKPLKPLYTKDFRDFEEYPDRESNSELSFRRALLYPFNYQGIGFRLQR